MKKYFDKGFATLSNKAATTASSLFGQIREDVSLVSVDVSKLTPEAAILQLQNQNSDLISRVRNLQGVTAENERYQQQIADLRSRVSELEADRARKAEVYRETQNRHKNSLERLQLECDAVAQQAKQRQTLEMENQALQTEVQEVRTKLIMQRTEAAQVPADCQEDWQALRGELEEQLGRMRQHAALRDAASSGGPQSAAARLADTEAALQDSQRQAHELTKKCDELQEEVDVLQRQRAASQKAAATSADNVPAAADHVEVPATAAAPLANSTSVPSGAEDPAMDGWGLDDGDWDAWGEGDRPTEVGPSTSSNAGKAAAGAAAGASGADEGADAAKGGTPAARPAAAEHLSREQPEDDAPAPAGNADRLSGQAVLAHIERMLFDKEDRDAAATLAGQLQGILCDASADMCRRSPSLGPVDLISPGACDGSAEDRSEAAMEAMPAAAQATPAAEQATPARIEGNMTAPSSMSTVGRSPFHATPSSSGGRGNAGAAGEHEHGLDSPAALSFNPLFDHQAATPDPAGVVAPARVPSRDIESHGQRGVAGLAIPLLSWDSLKPQQLAAHLRVLCCITAALGSLRSQNGSSSVGAAPAQADAAGADGDAPQTAAALREAVSTAEQKLASQIADLAPLAAAAPPRKLSGLGSESLQRQGSKGTVAPATPRSPGGSPAASTSIFGLHRTLQELLRAHESLLGACSEGGGEAAVKWRVEAKRLAAEAEAELQRLQALHMQQETEVAIQWQEKQQVQSTAQLQIAENNQELAVVRQQAEMYRAQLGELDAAYAQLEGECCALRAAAQVGPRLADEFASARAADLHAVLQPAAQASDAMLEGSRPYAGMPGGSMGDLIQLESGPGEEARTTHGVRGERELPDQGEQAAAEAGPSLGSSEEQVGQLRALVNELQGKLRDVTQERDTMLVGIGDIEQAAAARLDETEQEREELQAARAAATAAAGEAAIVEQTCKEHAEEIAKLRTLIAELQAVVHDAQHGAEQQEREIADLRAKVQAADGAAHAGDAGEGHADMGAEAAVAMEALKEQYRAAEDAAKEREEELQRRAAAAEAAAQELKGEHEAALVEVQEECAGKLEDVRMEAREQVKKGTADLQHALKAAQAQLQVVRTENATMKEQHAAVVREHEANIADLVQQAEQAQEQMRELEAAAEGRSTTAQREIGRLQSDNESLQGRVERMQKLNKEKKAELEKLQAQHSCTKQALQAAESQAEKVLKDLAAMTVRAESSAGKLKQAEVESKELAEIKAKVKPAPTSKAESSLVQQVEALMTAARQAAQLLDEAKMLRSSADEGAVLRGKVTELSAAAAESANAKQLLQSELAQAISDLAAAQDEVQVCKGTLVRVQKQAKQDRVQFETEMSKSGSYFACLPQSDVDAWPEPVQSLVRSKVGAAVEEARTKLQAQAVAALNEEESQRSCLNAQLQQATARAHGLEVELHACQAHEQQVREELRAQEAALQAQISGLQLRLERAVALAAPAQGAQETAQERLRQSEAKRAELEAEVTSLQRAVEVAHGEQQSARRHEGWGESVLEVTGCGDDFPRSAQSVEGGSERALAQDRAPASARLPTPLLRATSNQVSTDLADYWKQMYTEASQRAQELRKEVSLVQMELEDERHVHELRTLADGARKLEIQELQAVQGRADLNVEYLKNVLLGFFESGELPLNKQVLVVLDRLMLFTPQDRARVWKAEGRLQKPGWVPSLFK